MYAVLFYKWESFARTIFIKESLIFVLFVAVYLVVRGAYLHRTLGLGPAGLRRSSYIQHAWLDAARPAAPQATYMSIVRSPAVDFHHLYDMKVPVCVVSMGEVARGRRSQPHTTSQPHNVHGPRPVGLTPPLDRDARLTGRRSAAEDTPADGIHLPPLLQIRTVLELVVVLMSLQKLWGELIEIINSGWYSYIAGSQGTWNGVEMGSCIGILLTVGLQVCGPGGDGQERHMREL